MALTPTVCSGCGSTLAGTRCPQCGLERLDGSSGRRAVVVGAAALSATVGLGTWALVRAGGAKAEGSGGTWESDWHSGVAGMKKAADEQKKSKRPVLLYFYADWCGYCRKLESGVLSTAEGRSALRDVIKVRINAEAGRDEMRLAGEFGVRGYPTLFLVTHGGGLKRIRTPQTTEQLRQILG